MPGSYERLFHRTGLPRFMLDLEQLGEAAGGLREPRLQRAIGVIYWPQSERASHYLHWGRRRDLTQCPEVTTLRV